MKILIISGFLGAGKTTFIKELVKRRECNFVVLENEYGDQDIDGDLLRDETEIWELTEGCICCSMRSDFASSILTIANTLEPDFLIVEPTGLGLLSNVLQNIQKIEYERIQLLPPLTLVDMEAYQNFQREFPEIFEDQIANAGQILITKSEQHEKEEIENLVEHLEKLGAPHVEGTHYTNLPQIWWENLLQTTYTGNVTASDQTRPPVLEYVSFIQPFFSSIQQVIAYINVILRGDFGTVVRGKGFLEIQGQWGKFDLVGQKYTLCPCSPMPKAKILLIGKNLAKEKLAVLFSAHSHS